MSGIKEVLCQAKGKPMAKEEKSESKSKPYFKAKKKSK